MRTRNSIINTIVGILAQIFLIVVSFATRSVFLKVLGLEYLGLSNTLNSVISMLSMTELGIGSAIIFSLYQPVAADDREKIRSIMAFYARCYRYIALAVALIGLAVLPFLRYIIKDFSPGMKIVYQAYVFFLTDSVSSYFFSYKISLFTAYQKNYVVTSMSVGVKSAMTVAQIILLLTTGNYYLYLGAMVCFNLAYYIFLSVLADRYYPFLRQKHPPALERGQVGEIVRNVKAMFLHKVGGFFVFSVDNMIISGAIGVAVSGLYGNYSLVITQVNIIVNQFFSALTGSVGNLVATGSREKVYDTFQKLFFLSFWIYTFCTASLAALLDPFITTVWLDASCRLDPLTVWILVINFYLYGMRQPIMTSRDSAGLFRIDRYVPMAEAVVNLVLSLILAHFIGLPGVFLGTMINVLILSFWITPTIVYRRLFHQPPRLYFIRYTGYAACTALCVGLTYWLCSAWFPAGGLANFAGRCVLCLLVPNGIVALLYFRTNSFRQLRQLAADILRERRQRGKA